MSNSATLARDKHSKKAEIREEAANEDVVEKVQLPNTKSEPATNAANANSADIPAPLTLKEIAAQQETDSVTSTIQRPDNKSLSKKQRKQLKYQEAQAARAAAAKQTVVKAEAPTLETEKAETKKADVVEIKETDKKESAKEIASEKVSPPFGKEAPVETDRQLTLKESLEDAKLEKGIAIKVQGKASGAAGTMSSVIRDIQESRGPSEKKNKKKETTEKSSASRSEHTYKPSYREFMRQSRTLQDGRQPGWLAFRSSQQKLDTPEASGKELLERSRVQPRSGWKTLMQDKWIFLVIILGVIGLHSAFVYLIDSKGFDPVPASEMQVQENIDVKEGTVATTTPVDTNRGADEEISSNAELAAPITPANDNEPVSSNREQAGNESASTSGNKTNNSKELAKADPIAAASPDKASVAVSKTTESGAQVPVKVEDARLYKILNQN